MSSTTDRLSVLFGAIDQLTGDHQNPDQGIPTSGTLVAQSSEARRLVGFVDEPPTEYWRILRGYGRDTIIDVLREYGRVYRR